MEEALKKQNFREAFDTMVAEDPNKQIDKEDFVHMGQSLIIDLAKGSRPVKQLSTNLENLPLGLEKTDSILPERLALGLRPLLEHLFEALDEDHSGVIEKGEVEALFTIAEYFQLRGSDSDEEKQAKTKEALKKAAPDLLGIFQRLVDTNNDGSLDHKEVVAVVELFLELAATLSHSIFDTFELMFTEGTKDSMANQMMQMVAMSAGCEEQPT